MISIENTLLGFRDFDQQIINAIKSTFYRSWVDWPGNKIIDPVETIKVTAIRLTQYNDMLKSKLRLIDEKDRNEEINRERKRIYDAIDTEYWHYHISEKWSSQYEIVEAEVEFKYRGAINYEVLERWKEFYLNVSIITFLDELLGSSEDFKNIEYDLKDILITDDYENLYIKIKSLAEGRSATPIAYICMALVKKGILPHPEHKDLSKWWRVFEKEFNCVYTSKEGGEKGFIKAYGGLLKRLEANYADDYKTKQKLDEIISSLSNNNW